MSSKSPVSAFMLPITLTSFGLNEELLKSFPEDQQLAIREMLSKPTNVFMNMAIHEAFHAYQGSYWQAFESDHEELNRDFYAACVKNAVWSQAYFSELDLWALHMEELVGAKTIDQLSLVKIAKQVLTNRERSGMKDKVAQRCWDSNFA